MALKTFKEYLSNPTPPPTKVGSSSVPSFGDFLKSYTPPPDTSIKGKISDYAQSSADIIPTFINAISNPIETLKKGAEFVKDTYMSGVKKAGEGLYDIVKTPGLSNKIAGAANLVTGTASAAFTPITTVFEAAKNTPGLKQVADVVELPFIGLGKVGEWTVGKAIDAIPEVIVSKESKDIIKKPLEEVGALALQIYGGKFLEGKISEYTKNKKALTKEDAIKLSEEVRTEIAKQPIPTPKKTFAEYSKEQGYEPYAKELPTIEMGKKTPSSGLPTIPTEPTYTAPVPKGMKVEPIIPEFPTTPERVVSGLKAEPVKNSPEVPKVELTKSADRLAESMIEERKIDLKRELTVAEKLTLKEQANIATELAQKQFEKTSKMVLNRERLPGVEEGHALEAVGSEAFKRGDFKTGTDAALKYAEVGTESGRALKGFDTEVGFKNPVLKTMRLISDIYKDKIQGKPKDMSIADFKAKKMAELTTELESRFQKLEIPKSAVAEFISSIKC